ncbi:MAG TPA: 3-deoxy-D-manno-octulosonic acid transferase, partial [Candidatus Hypogeohydataceae bacterium YC38]
RLGWLPTRDGSRPCLWVHGASVGEVLTARSLVTTVEESLPGWDIVLSTSTNTGFSVAKKNFEDKLVFYFPLDFSWVDRKALSLLKPNCIILVELEIWPNFLVAAVQRGIPVVLVNGRISERSTKVLKTLRLFSRSFSQSLQAPGNIYCVRTQTDATRFLKLGIPEEKVIITGNMKYDNIPLAVPEEEKERLRQSFRISPEDLVIVGGSTHPGEEEILLRVFKTLRATLPIRLILVPRHIERAQEVEGLIRNMGFPLVKKSLLDKTGDFPTNPRDTVLVVDTMGELTKIYSLAHCVFVGKSLKGLGGQNVLEPAGLARPTIFGPNMTNFQEEANLLLEADAARLVHNEEELLATVGHLLRTRQEAEAMGLRAQKVVTENRGATLRNLKVLEKILRENKTR